MQIISSLNTQFFRYLMVGGMAFFIHLLVAFIYLYFVEYSLYLSNLVGFLIAFVFSYASQTKYVFQSKIRFNRLVKYFIVQVIMINTGALIIDNISIYNFYVNTIFILIFITPASFFVHKFWTFTHN